MPPSCPLAAWPGSWLCMGPWPPWPHLLSALWPDRSTARASQAQRRASPATPTTVPFRRGAGGWVSVQARARAGVQSRSRWGRRPGTAGAEGAPRLSPGGRAPAAAPLGFSPGPIGRSDCRAGPGVSVTLKGCISPCLNFWGPPLNNASPARNTWHSYKEQSEPLLSPGERRPVWSAHARLGLFRRGGSSPDPSGAWGAEVCTPFPAR